MRFPDWRPRLVAYMARVAPLPFRPGVHDCALFVAGAVAAMTGTDPARGWRGCYTTLRGGLRVLRRAGFADHVALVASRHRAKPVAMAQVGDIAVVPAPDGSALGIVQGAGVYVLRPEGLAVVPLTAATAAFGV